MVRDDSAERLWKAESLIVLLGKMNLERLPPHEGRAVGECQAKAMEEWLAAYLDLDLNQTNPPRHDSAQTAARLG